MTLALRAVLLVFLAALCAQGQNPTLAVYTGSIPDLETSAAISMRAEVQRLFAPAGFEIVWRNIAQRRSGENFDVVVVASFGGSCSTNVVTTASAGASLADTSITNGRILPFFRIDCRRVLEVLQMAGSDLEAPVIGRALGRVMAHEMYHIVARTTEHHDTGVAKAAFSSRDLVTPRFEFDAWSVARMRPQIIAESPAAAAGAATGR
jgi:hypothetical protein